MFKLALPGYRRDSPKDSELEQLEASAKAKKLGLWSDSNPQPPWEFQHGKVSVRTPAAATGQGSIVGNRNSHVYHLPRCPGYNSMIEKNKIVFDNEQQAVKAG